MQTEHWGAISGNEDNGIITPDKVIASAVKKPKLDEIRQREEPVADEKHDTIEVRSSVITQTIEVMKQTEVLQSLIDTYSNKNGSSNYLLNPCQMIPEVDFPPENAADLVSEQKFQKPIWFIPCVNTSYSRGDPQPHPEISSNVCRQALRKVMCGLLRLAGFTDCSETAIILLTGAAEEFLRSFVTNYRTFYDIDEKLETSTSLQLLPLEQAYFSMTGTSLTQVHNYYKHKVITRNRAEIAEFDSVLQDYDKLMKESQNSMQKQQQQHNNHEFNGNDFLNILEMQPSDDGNNSTTGSSSMGHIVGDVLHELGGNSTNSSISLSNVSNGHQQQAQTQPQSQQQMQQQQQQIINSNALYGLLEGQLNNSSGANVSAASGYQTNFEN